MQKTCILSSYLCSRLVNSIDLNFDTYGNCRVFRGAEKQDGEEEC